MRTQGGITTIARSGNDTQKWHKLEKGEIAGDAPKPKLPEGEAVGRYMSMGKTLREIDQYLASYSYSSQVTIQRSNVKSEMFDLQDLDGRTAEMEYRLTPSIPLKNNLENKFKAFKTRFQSINDNRSYREAFREALHDLLHSNDNLQQVIAHDILEVYHSQKGGKSVKDFFDDKNNIDNTLKAVDKKVKGSQYLDELYSARLAIQTGGLSAKIENFRLKYGIPTTLQTASSAKASLTINGQSTVIEKLGASPNVKKMVTDNSMMPTTVNQRYMNKNSDGSTYHNFDANNHAEQDNLGQIADAIDEKLKISSTDMSQQAKNKREGVTGDVYMYVSKEVCVMCKSGLSPSHKTVGSLVQFSKDFPNIILKVNDIENLTLTTIINGTKQ